MKKVVQNGRVAVIYSPGFGAGWSTWTGDKNVCFDPILVEWIENGKNGEPPLDHYGDDAPYAGGLSDAEIAWIAFSPPALINGLLGKKGAKCAATPIGPIPGPPPPWGIQNVLCKLICITSAPNFPGLHNPTNAFKFAPSM